MSPSVEAKTGFMSKVPRGVLWAVVGIIVVLIAALVIAVYFTSKPAFFNGYSSLQRHYKELQTSSHKGIACDQCHGDTRGPVVYRVALVGDFYRGLVGRPSGLTFVKLAKPSRAACLACHSRDWAWDAKQTAKVPHPAHLRVIEEKRDCVKCHKWTAHEEAYMQKHKTMPFSDVCASFGCHVGSKPASDCKDCHHQLRQSTGVWKDDHPQIVLAKGMNSCLERCHDADQCRLCHTTGKTPVFAANNAATGVTVIEQAHVKADWLAQHGTFALQDQSKCLTCHVSEAECADCHSKRPAFHGLKSTWLGQHKELSKDPRRCLACHQQSWCDACHKQFKEMR